MLISFIELDSSYTVAHLVFRVIPSTLLQGWIQKQHDERAWLVGRQNIELFYLCVRQIFTDCLGMAEMKGIGSAFEDMGT